MKTMLKGREELEEKLTNGG